VPRSSDADVRRLAFECAWGVSLGMTVEELVASTGRSRPTIYRALEHARLLEWLDDRPRLTIPPGPERDEYEATVADRYSATEVAAAIGGGRPREVIVAPAPPQTPDESTAAAVCTALRACPLHRELWKSAMDPTWERHVDELAAQVIQTLQSTAQQTGDPELCAAARQSPDRIRMTVAKYANDPYTERDLQRSQRVGRAAADLFCRALEEDRVRCVGLSWGHHVHDFVAAVSLEFPAYIHVAGADSVARQAAQRLLVFPLIGSLGLPPVLDHREYGTQRGAIANASALARQIGAPQPIHLTQPVHIPRDFETADLRRIWEYVQQDASIRQCLGERVADRYVDDDGVGRPDFAETQCPAPDSSGYIHRADTLITGLGTCDGDSRATRLGLYDDEDVPRLVQAGAVGDISGRLFWDPTDPPDEDGKRAIRFVNSYVISPQLGDFIAANDRARASQTGLGTVVVASGPARARAVRALCSWGAVTTLVIDSDLARALRALREPAAGPRGTG